MSARGNAHSRKTRAQRGVALVSTLFFLVIMTVLAAGALMLSTVQMKVAGSVAWWESAYAAAQGCLNYSIPIIKFAHYDAYIPPEFCPDLTDGCVPKAEPDFLLFVDEVQNPANQHHIDREDIRLAGINGLNCSIDVDSIGATVMPGGQIELPWAYHGGAYSSGMMVGYRANSTAATPSFTVRGQTQQIIWFRYGL